jgi:hypothetical protein
MQLSSSILTREEEEKLLTPHEYIRDTISFRYQNCVFCGNRTEFTCIKCGYCYICHWKKEQIEDIELRDNLKDYYVSLSKVSNDSTDNNNGGQELKLQQASKEEEQKEWRTIDVFGQQSEPICTYYGCNHKFSAHSLESHGCKCKHPTNKTWNIIKNSNTSICITFDAIIYLRLAVVVFHS